MEEAAQNFEKAWRRFETSFKGKLLTKSRTQSLTLSQANLILKEVSSDWFSGYGLEGKWLRDYKDECPDRAEAITTFLKHELRLTNEAKLSQYNQTLSSSTRSESSLAGIISAIIAALRGTLESFLKDSSKSSSPRSKQGAIDKYVAQLQVHKKVILDVIQKSEMVWGEGGEHE